VKRGSLAPLLLLSPHAAFPLFPSIFCAPLRSLDLRVSPLVLLALIFPLGEVTPVDKNHVCEGQLPGFVHRPSELARRLGIHDTSDCVQVEALGHFRRHHLICVLLEESGDDRHGVRARGRVNHHQVEARGTGQGLLGEHVFNVPPHRAADAAARHLFDDLGDVATLGQGVCLRRPACFAQGVTEVSHRWDERKHLSTPRAQDTQARRRRRKSTKLLKSFNGMCDKWTNT